MREENREIRKYINLILIGTAILCVAIIVKDVFWIGYSLVLTLKAQGFTWYSLIVFILASIVLCVIIGYLKSKIKAEYER